MGTPATLDNSVRRSSYDQRMAEKLAANARTGTEDLVHTVEDTFQLGPAGHTGPGWRVARVAVDLVGAAAFGCIGAATGVVGAVAATTTLGWSISPAISAGVLGTIGVGGAAWGALARGTTSTAWPIIAAIAIGVVAAIGVGVLLAPHIGILAVTIAVSATVGVGSAVLWRALRDYVAVKEPQPFMAPEELPTKQLPVGSMGGHEEVPLIDPQMAGAHA